LKDGALLKLEHHLLSIKISGEKEERSVLSAAAPPHFIISASSWQIAQVVFNLGN
jgi:hypothetical protein